MSKATEIQEFLTGKTFFVATVHENKPKVRPFGFSMEFEEKLYLATNDGKPSYFQLQENPYIEISASIRKPEGSEWVRISGKAVFDHRDEVKMKAFEAAPIFKEIYDLEGSPELKLFYISEGMATFQRIGFSDVRTISF
ncbi:MAG: pyridoxamine 5'-phosphate oxidase family protein [Clostridiales bacterium]|nr:pyridoxamine 5'-phosphate oxidase family protein [Clostridiales bacterium]